jgi:DNA-binding transcriptional MerR regulator
LLYSPKITVAEAAIPRRALFKSSEVCEIAAVQPYVLRSWESEFPDLGVSKGNGGPRVYRRADVERVLRIKQLVFSDGLTLAGVRRRIEEEAPATLDKADASAMRELLGRHARERLADIRTGLRAILELLSARPGESEMRQLSHPPAVRPGESEMRQLSRPAAVPPAARAKPTARSRSSKAAPKARKRRR